jgi:hypothetical protein
MATKRMDEATKKRVRAGRLPQNGKKPAEIALDVGVNRQTVYTWKAIFDEGDIDALRAVPLPFGVDRPSSMSSSVKNYAAPYCKTQHQEGRACRVPQGASETALAGDLGWCQVAPQSICARLRRQLGRAYVAPCQSKTAALIKLALTATWRSLKLQK